MQAFDRLAPAYDETFSHSPIGSYLRGRVQRRLDRHFLAGDQVLELGCGTGEDALYLAQRGVQVTATDSSQVMLDITRSKATGNPLLRVIPLDIRQPILDDERQFEGCLANFGPLNVLTDRRPLAKWLAAWIKPGGIAGLGVMGPLCLWEIGWHSLHGDFKTAFRRLKGEARFQADEHSTGIPIYYPAIAELEDEFAPWFQRIHVEALGLFLPSSDIYGVLDKRPGLRKMLMALEERCTTLPFTARFADHYWIEFRRHSGPDDRSTLA